MPSIYGELSPEGRKMWDNLRTEFKVTTIPKSKPIKMTPCQMEVEFFREQLTVLIENSKKVVQDCDVILSTFKKKEEYLKSDVKTAKLIHTNNIERLSRILEGKLAFK